MADKSQSRVSPVPAPIHKQHDEEKDDSQAAEKSSKEKKEFTDWAAI